MQLYSKRFNEYEVPIPEDAIICDDEYLVGLKNEPYYPLHYCWEENLLSGSDYQLQRVEIDAENNILVG